MTRASAPAAGGMYEPGVSLLTCAVSALFGISICARGECASKQLRVNEHRIAAYLKMHHEADPAGGFYSNWANGELVVDLAESDTKGEIVLATPQGFEKAAERLT